MSSPAQPPRRRAWLLLGLACAVLACAYLPLWSAGWVWDDAGHLTRPELRGLGGLARIWSEPRATQQYYPLLHTLFWIEDALWGARPLDYHLVNLALHALVATGVWRLAQRLSIPGAWAIALVFALHPVQVESVAWVSEQKNTLSGVFYVAAWLCWLRFDAGLARKQRLWGAWTLSLVLALAAVLSKSVTLTLAPAILIATWWREGGWGWLRRVPWLLPHALLALALGLFTAWLEVHVGGARGAGYEPLDLAQRCIVAGKDLWFYLGRLAWPAGTCFVYPRWQSGPIAAWEWDPAAGLRRAARGELPRARAAGPRRLRGAALLRAHAGAGAGFLRRDPVPLLLRGGSLPVPGLPGSAGARAGRRGELGRARARAACAARAGRAGADRAGAGRPLLPDTRATSARGDALARDLALQPRGLDGRRRTWLSCSTRRDATSRRRGIAQAREQLQLRLDLRGIALQPQAHAEALWFAGLEQREPDVQAPRTAARPERAARPSLLGFERALALEPAVAVRAHTAARQRAARAGTLGGGARGVPARAGARRGRRRQLVRPGRGAPAAPATTGARPRTTTGPWTASRDIWVRGSTARSPGRTSQARHGARRARGPGARGRGKRRRRGARRRCAFSAPALTQDIGCFECAPWRKASSRDDEAAAREGAREHMPCYLHLGGPVPRGTAITLSPVSQVRHTSLFPA
jgi:hypothetical protein